MRNLRLESLSGGTGVRTGFDFKQFSFNLFSSYRPLKRRRTEVALYRSAVIAEEAYQN